MIESPTPVAEDSPPPAPVAPAASALWRWLAVLCGAALVVVAWGGLALWGLGEPAFHTKGEPREGLVVWEMVHGGGWVLPMRNGDELPSKPPLFHWLGALTSLRHGHVDEWSIRLPSALLSLFGCVLVFAAGSAWWSPRAGTIAALVLMTTFEWARAATNGRVDMTLTFGLEVAALSLAFFWRRARAIYLLALYPGIAWAVLGKGPVGVALPVLATILLLLLSFDRAAWARRDWRATLDFQMLLQMRLAYGALAVLLIAGSWYVLAFYVGGMPFFWKVMAENLFTFVDDADFGGGHRHGLLYMPLQLLLGFLPWTLFLPPLAASLWRERKIFTRRDARTPLLVWIGVVAIFYEVAASKRGVYLLALYPAVALLLGWWWDKQWDRIGRDGSLARGLAWVCAALTIIVLIAALLCFLSGAGVPVAVLAARWAKAKARGDIEIAAAVLQSQGWRLGLALVLAAGAALGAYRAALRRHWSWVFGSVLTSTAIALIAVRILVMPSLAQRLTLRGFMQEVAQTAGRPADLGFYQTFDYGAVYYSQQHIARYQSLPGKAPQYLLVQSDRWQNGAAELAAYEPVPLASQRELLLLRRRDSH